MSELRITRDCFVVLDYVLYDDEGEIVDATDDEDGRPIAFVHGYGALVPGLEQGIVGMAAGETKEIVVPPSAGYGAWNEDGEAWVDRADFPPDVEVEDEFAATDEHGEETTLRIVEVTEDAVLVDTNHPLSGEVLRFDVVVRAVRKATAEEIGVARTAGPPRRLQVLEGSAAEPAAKPKGRAGTHPREERLRKGDPPAVLPAELDDEQ